jgi:hypothetical protein
MSDANRTHPSAYTVSARGVMNGKATAVAALILVGLLPSGCKTR